MESGVTGWACDWLERPVRRENFVLPTQQAEHYCTLHAAANHGPVQMRGMCGVMLRRRHTYIAAACF